jgi:hypothetical protein
MSPRVAKKSGVTLAPPGRGSIAAIDALGAPRCRMACGRRSRNLGSKDW